MRTIACYDQLHGTAPCLVFSCAGAVVFYPFYALCRYRRGISPVLPEPESPMLIPAPAGSRRTAGSAIPWCEDWSTIRVRTDTANDANTTDPRQKQVQSKFK